MASSPPGNPEGFDVRAARDALGSPNARGPLPHAESLHALDWLNFFLAALLMGLGPFVAVKLADRGWVPATIGLVLTASGVAGLLTRTFFLLLSPHRRNALIYQKYHTPARRPMCP
jgi:hypothetical protein